MLIDPHETHKRTNSFSKKDNDEKFFNTVNHALADVKFPSHKKSEGLNVATLPIIYIVGAPRSGTTLLSQLLSSHLRVGYINNLIARFWQRPSVGIYLCHALLDDLGRGNIGFNSKHGTTQGIEGPHEFGYFWREWMALDNAETHNLSQREVEAIDLLGLKQILEDEILSSFGSPVVFKNVICGFQAEILSRVHPASLFVWIKREPEDVVRSILKCRMERYGSYNAWWSLKPSTYAQLIKIDCPVEQALQQVLDCMNELDQEFKKPNVSSLTINYSTLIEKPSTVLHEVCNAVRKLGFEMNPLSKKFPVFQPQSKICLPDNLEEVCNAIFSN